MASKVKRWTGLGLSTALLGTTLVTGCGSDAPGEAGEAGEQAAAAPDETNRPEPVAAAGELGETPAGERGEGEGGEGEAGELGGELGEGEGGEAGRALGTLPLPERLAFMTGHVQAGLALYRAGQPEMAAKHLLHPVSETHAAEREGLAALGFRPALFEAVSAALEAGRPAGEVEPQLRAAETHLAELAQAAGGDAAEVIRYLLDTTVEEYEIGVRHGEIVEPGEYQDAYGFVIVARDRARSLPAGPARDEVLSELDALAALWPEGPVPVASPAPVSEVSSRTSRVLLALP